METLNKERQQAFNEIRHYVSSKHQVPEHLTLGVLELILNVLENKREEIK